MRWREVTTDGVTRFCGMDQDHPNSSFKFMFCITIFKFKVFFISYVFELN